MWAPIVINLLVSRSRSCFSLNIHLPFVWPKSKSLTFSFRRICRKSGAVEIAYYSGSGSVTSGGRSLGTTDLLSLAFLTVFPTYEDFLLLLAKSFLFEPLFTTSLLFVSLGFSGFCSGSF